MLTEGAKKWVEALRSGEFPQGRLRLGDDKMGYCCLGVACQVAIQEGILDKDNYASALVDLTEYPEVQEWLNLNTADGAFVDDQARSNSLATLNDGTGYGPDDHDGGLPFDKIADVIEAAPYLLFRKSE